MSIQYIISRNCQSVLRRESIFVRITRIVLHIPGTNYTYCTIVYDHSDVKENPDIVGADRAHSPQRLF